MGHSKPARHRKISYRSAWGTSEAIHLQWVPASCCASPLSSDLHAELNPYHHPPNPTLQRHATWMMAAWLVCSGVQRCCAAEICVTTTEMFHSPASSSCLGRLAAGRRQPFRKAAVAPRPDGASDSYRRHTVSLDVKSSALFS